MSISLSSQCLDDVRLGGWAGEAVDEPKKSPIQSAGLTARRATAAQAGSGSGGVGELACPACPLRCAVRRGAWRQARSNGVRQVADAAEEGAHPPEWAAAAAIRRYAGTKSFPLWPFWNAVVRGD